MLYSRLTYASGIAGLAGDKGVSNPGDLAISKRASEVGQTPHPAKINDSHFHPTGYTAAQRINIRSYVESLRTIIRYMDAANVGQTALMCIPTYVRSPNGTDHLVDCEGRRVGSTSGGDYQHVGELRAGAAATGSDGAGRPAAAGDSSLSSSPRTVPFSAILGRAPQYYVPEDLRNQPEAMNPERLAETRVVQQAYRPEVDLELAHAVNKLEPCERARFNPMITGLDLADGNTPHHILNLLNEFPGVFDGIGEITIRKEVVSAQNAGYAPAFDAAAPINNVLLMAARIGAPVFIHCDIDDHESQANRRTEQRDAVPTLPSGKFDDLDSKGKAFLKIMKDAQEPSPAMLQDGRLARSLRRSASLSQLDATPAIPIENHRDLAKLQWSWPAAGKAYVADYIALNPARDPEPKYFRDIEGLFKRHPTAQIVWAHCGGLGRYVQPHPNHVGFMREVMKSCPNVKIDLSWDVVAKYFLPQEGPEHERQLAHARLAMLVGLIQEYPKRFLFGSDALVPKGPESLLSGYKIFNGHEPDSPGIRPGDPHSADRLSLSSMLTPTERHFVFSWNHRDMFDEARRNIRRYETTQMSQDFDTLDKIKAANNGTLPNHWPEHMGR